MDKVPSILSMTGFGRGSKAGKKFRATVELRSVNGRFLEIRPKVPKAISFLEPVLREKLEARLSRGVVDMTVTVQPLEPSVHTHFDEALARAYSEKAVTFARDFGLNHGLTALALLKLPGVMGTEDSTSLEDEKELPEVVGAAVTEALENLVVMRRREGEKLGLVLQRELDELISHQEWMKDHRGELNERHEKRLKTRLNEWMEKSRNGIDEARLYQEIAFYLDRSDVTEELDRLSSHLKQCEDALYGKLNKSVGKRLEFLAQELGREVNTIGAKSDQALITSRVVEMKLTLEKIREQVQNLE